MTIDLINSPVHINADFFVLTGGPGAGKTTLLDALEKKGMTCLPEVARQIIKEQMDRGGTALPWKDTSRYTALMLEASIQQYLQATVARQRPLFFDRGIPDTIAYAKLIGHPVTPWMNAAAAKLRYNRKVFILPPWKEIYTPDTERKQSWEEAILTFEVLRDTYKEYDYSVTEILPATVPQRLSALLGNILK